ncbi:hypothetical protein FXO38_07799 [Capsicum annuum]|nr:hypothetical protein FXO38_07799 [Capsicum annuum]
MDDNECNNQLRATLHDLFGLEDSDSLHGNEDSYSGYAEGPDRYLDTDDKDLQNLADEETNRSHQSVQDEDLSIFYGEEDHYGENDFEKEEGPIHDDSYTEEQYTTGPVEGMCFRYVKSAFAFYKEYSRLSGFGVVKKSAKKEAGQLKYVTFGCDKCQKTTARNQSKRVNAKGFEQDYEEEYRSTRHCRSKAVKEHKVLGGLSWRPRKNEAAYRDFSDVIFFDTTYLVNQWRMSFSSFISVNHHNHSILLGCALLTSEDIETYVFVFKTWLTAIGEIPPMAILTDQCESIKAAICEVLPNTIHRFKYEKELESYASERKQLVRPTIAFDWDMQIYGHYTRAIYDFFRVHVVRLPHCEIERHVDFNAVEGVEVYNVTDCFIRSDYHGDNFVFTVEYCPANQYIECNYKTFESKGIVCCHIMRMMTFKKIRLFHDRYILRHWRRDIVRPHLSKFFSGGYPIMTGEYRVYNGIKK